MDRAVVRAPATIANLGAGFDCLGIAVDLHNEITVERASEGTLEVVIEGEGSERIPADERNLTVRAVRTFLGEQAGLRIRASNGVPYGRGLGSSAAAIVAGVLAGAVLSESHGGSILLERSVELEGHGDNVAPCLYGGVAVVSGTRALAFEPPEAVVPVVCVAPAPFSTKKARGALPESLSFGDAVDSVRRAALLVAALASGAPGPLFEATEDVLHQPARFALMPETAAVVGGLREEGHAAFLSGAGPSVALLAPAGEAAAAAETARRLVPEGWTVRESRFDRGGAVVVERG